MASSHTHTHLCRNLQVAIIIEMMMTVSLSCQLANGCTHFELQRVCGSSIHAGLVPAWSRVLAKAVH